MQVSLHNENLVAVRFAYNLLTKNLVKSLDGSKWDKERKCWLLAINSNLPGSLDILQRAGFIVSGDIQAALEKNASLRGVLERLAEAKTAEFTTKLPLLPYQRVGAQFLLKAGSAVLGDDVGLGKTLTAIAVMEARPEVKKILVFCPAVLKYQWAAEIVKFLGENFADNRNNSEKKYQWTQVIDGSGARRAKQWADQWPYKYYIANYELLLRDFEFMSLIKWDYIVADEATKISNSRSKTGKAIKKLRSRYRLALTGTPISNRPDDVWNIVDFVAPGVFGNYYNFVDKYAIRGQFNEIFYYTNLEELAGRLKPYLIRRMKADVLKELPEKRIIDVPFKLSEAERELYNKIRAELLFEIEHMDISKLNTPMTIQLTIVKMTRLRQLVDSMELLGERKISSKLEVLKELLLELADRKIIIFSEFSEMCKILKREIDHSEMIIGEADAVSRQRAVEKFNADFNTKILIMSSAGAYGLNLQAASVIIHIDQPFSYAKLIQREGRAHRMGQKNTVLVYNLLTEIDHKIKKIIDGKVKMSSQVLGDAPPTMAEIKEMLQNENPPS